MRAIMLLSGGLDSILAARVLQEQGIELLALNFVSVFCNCTPRSSCCSSASKAVRQLGIDLKVLNKSEEFLRILRAPPHGYGSHLNPCLDCRILMFTKAKAYMQETGAFFIVTGEVLGERPMSQRREAMKLIEKESGLNGLVLRPLSAQLLEPTIPEQSGWVDRARLLAIAGRSRKPQIQLAKEFGINDYPCPAGGCLLTDPGFVVRMRDLMDAQPEFTLNDVQLLKLGRHFRLSPRAKIIVGRDEAENLRLTGLAQKDDLLLEAVDLPGPVTLLRNADDPSHELLAAQLTAGHGKARALPEVAVAVRDIKGQTLRQTRVAPLAGDAAPCARVG